MLDEAKRKQLDGIVQQMISNKESDSNIQFVVKDFTNKYNSTGLGALPPPAQPNAFKKIGGFLGNVTGVSDIYGALKDTLTTPQPKFGINTKIAEKAIGGAVKLGTTLGSFGAGSIPATVAGRIGMGGVLGGLTGAGQGLANQGDAGDVAKATLIGGAVGAGTSGLLEGAKWAIKGVPKLLSYTSSTPEEVLQRNYDNPQAMKQALSEVKTSKPTGILGHVQDAVRTLRKNLTQQWDEGANQVVKDNLGKRLGFNQTEQKLFKEISQEFGVDLPNNMSNMSAKETLELNKGINELFSRRDIREGAKGVFIRKAKDLLDSNLEQFQGAKDLLKNYSGEKSVFDAANQLFKAYSTRNPVAQKTALSRLKMTFNDNSPSYLSALKDLEEHTGIPLTNKVAALNILNKMPKGNAFTVALKDLLLPVTSPRIAGAASRTAGRFVISGAPEAIRRGVVQTGISEFGRQ